MNHLASKLMHDIFAASATRAPVMPAASALSTMRTLSALETKAVAGGPQIINDPKPPV
jgi:hypothetical protein